MSHHHGAYTPPEPPLSFDAREPVRGAGPMPTTLIASVVLLAVVAGGGIMLLRHGQTPAAASPVARPRPSPSLDAVVESARRQSAPARTEPRATALTVIPTLRAPVSPPDAVTRIAAPARPPARPCPGICLITGRTPPAISPSAAARPRVATSCGVCP